MKIGVLGSGDVAQTLGSGFLTHGHEVMLGTRDVSKLDTWRTQAGAHARAGSFADAAAFGDRLVLATRGVATPQVIDTAGKANFDGKVVYDATNPLQFDDRGPHLATVNGTSLGEAVQRTVPHAKVVKVFNTVGSTLMVNPKLVHGPGDMFFAGNDADAKRDVAQTVTEFGWNPIDLGDIEAARYLEAMCMAWVLYGKRTNTWNHAFKFISTS